jgi:hypothetical protein
MEGQLATVSINKYLQDVSKPNARALMEIPSRRNSAQVKPYLPQAAKRIITTQTSSTLVIRDKLSVKSARPKKARRELLFTVRTVYRTFAPLVIQISTGQVSARLTGVSAEVKTRTYNSYLQLTLLSKL